MDLSILNRMATETLMTMQNQIEAILESRLDTRLMPGRIATFMASDGVIRTVVIQRINTKSVSCEETGASVRPGSKWRVGKSSLTVVPVIVKSKPAPSDIKTSKPSTVASDAW